MRSTIQLCPVLIALLSACAESGVDPAGEDGDDFGDSADVVPGREVVLTPEKRLAMFRPPHRGGYHVGVTLRAVGAGTARVVATTWPRNQPLATLEVREGNTPDVHGLRVAEWDVDWILKFNLVSDTPVALRYQACPLDDDTQTNLFDQHVSQFVTGEATSRKKVGELYSSDEDAYSFSIKDEWNVVPGGGEAVEIRIEGTDLSPDQLEANFHCHSDRLTNVPFRRSVDGAGIHVLSVTPDCPSDDESGTVHLKVRNHADRKTSFSCQQYAITATVDTSVL